MNNKKVVRAMDDVYQSVLTEEGVKYVNYWQDIDPKFWQEYEDKYEMKGDCSNECKICQLSHIDKYKEKYGNTPRESISEYLASGEKKNLSHAWQITCPLIPKDYRDNLPKLFSLGITEEQTAMAVALNDPAAFAAKYFRWKPRKHQEVMLRCQSKRKVLRWGRRAGKTEAFVIETLWHALTKTKTHVDPVTGEEFKEGLKILMVAPYESQVINFFDMLLKFLERSDGKFNYVKYRKSPHHHMEFGNKAVIKGFTTGANEAESLRGQDAHIIILDEVDYMSAGDYKTIMPIANSHPDVLIRASSTPKGKREKFFQWCYLPGTDISLDSGTIPIEDIDSNMQVLSAYGKIDKVIEPMVRDYDGDVYTIRSWYGLPTTATGEHPIYVYRDGEYQFLPVSELTKGIKPSPKRAYENSDYLVVPFRPPRQESFNLNKGYAPEADKAEAFGKRIEELLREGKTKKKISKILNVTRRTIFKYLKMKRDTGHYRDPRITKTILKAETLLQRIKNEKNLQWLGLYLAEGHITYTAETYASGATWTFHKDEMDLAEEVTRSLTRLGLNFQLKDKSDIDNTKQVICYSSALGWLFKNIFGEKEHKRVPEFIDSATQEQQEAFTIGVFLGDGYSRNGYVGLALTAKEAIRDLYYVMLKNYQAVSLTNIPKRGKSKLDKLALSTIEDPEKHNRFIWKEDHVLLRLAQIRKKHYHGLVYNFETANSHTYVADMYGTHNCTTNPQWKEFYFPTPVIEHTPIKEMGLTWGQMRREMRPEYSHDDWMQEVMAIFIASASGVYQPAFVSRAMRDYHYEQLTKQRVNNAPETAAYRYSMGVDWNSNVGTEICILGYNPNAEPRFKVMSMINVPKQEYTQYKGLSRVTDLFSLWKPSHVYVDAGAGATNYETLKLWAAQQPPGSYEKSLMHRLTRFQFGGNVEIRDPVTRQKIKYPGKSYMVENSVRQFENADIAFSFHDDKLRKQLLNYIIKSRAESGKPIYGQENSEIGDHALDALNLALVAWALEEGVFAKNSFMSNEISVGIVGSPAHKDILDQMRERNDGMGMGTGHSILGAIEERESAISRRSGKMLARNSDSNVIIPGISPSTYIPGMETDDEDRNRKAHSQRVKEWRNLISHKSNLGRPNRKGRGDF